MGSTYTYSTFSYSIVVKTVELNTHALAYFELKEIKKVLAKINIPSKIMKLIQNYVFWNLVEEEKYYFGYNVYMKCNQEKKSSFQVLLNMKCVDLLKDILN